MSVLNTIDFDSVEHRALHSSNVVSLQDESTTPYEGLALRGPAQSLSLSHADEKCAASSSSLSAHSLGESPSQPLSDICFSESIISNEDDNDDDDFMFCMPTPPQLPFPEAPKIELPIAEVPKIELPVAEALKKELPRLHDLSRKAGVCCH